MLSADPSYNQVMLPDDDFISGFEAASLTEFHHADHVRLTILYLARHGRDDALRRLTAGIRRLAAADGHPEKFHVTMTRAWLEVIEAARAKHPEARDPASLLAACPELLDRHVLRQCYSRERLESDRARTEWMPPDLGALDSILGGVTDQKTPD
jgi:hypothetical protein